MFKSFRSRLIFSYVAIVVLVLAVAFTGTLVLAKFYGDRTDFRTLEQKSALVLPFVQLELANPRRPLTQQFLERMKESVRASQVRILFVNPETMKIEQDTSMRFDSVGERFMMDDLDPGFLGLSAQKGVRGRFTLPGENATFLYTAYRLRGLVQSAGTTGTGRDAAPARQPGNVIVVFAQPERGIRDLARELLDYFGLAVLLALLLAVVAAFWLGRSISRPVARLSVGTQAIARGDYSQQLPVEGRDELSALTERFNEMAAEVNRAHRMERDFVANVSHDLKTPLTSIQGFSQAMLDGAIEDVAGYRQAASIINSEAERMGRLVNELLSLSKLQNQLSSMERKPVNLGKLLSQLVLAMQP
jgi:two-component system OmpR family sensor kinase